MQPISAIEEVSRAAKQPVTQAHDLTNELSYWFQAFPTCIYLQPYLIDGRQALICLRQLIALCRRFAANMASLLKEDARQSGSAPAVMLNHRSAAVASTMPSHSAFKIAHCLKWPHTLSVSQAFFLVLMRRLKAIDCAVLCKHRIGRMQSPSCLKPTITQAYRNAIR